MCFLFVLPYSCTIFVGGAAGNGGKQPERLFVFFLVSYFADAEASKHMGMF